MKTLIKYLKESLRIGINKCIPIMSESLRIGINDSPEQLTLENTSTAYRLEFYENEYFVFNEYIITRCEPYEGNGKYKVDGRPINNDNYTFASCIFEYNEEINAYQLNHKLALEILLLPDDSRLQNMKNILNDVLTSSSLFSPKKVLMEIFRKNKADSFISTLNYPYCDINLPFRKAQVNDEEIKEIINKL